MAVVTHNTHLHVGRGARLGPVRLTPLYVRCIHELLCIHTLYIIYKVISNDYLMHHDHSANHYTAKNSIKMMETSK